MVSSGSIKPHGEEWKSTQPGRFPQSCGAESEATRFCWCLGNASSFYVSLRNNDPSQLPTTTTEEEAGADDGALVREQPRLQWLLLLPGGFQGCQIRRGSAHSACAVAVVRMHPARERILGRVSELCCILGGCMPAPAVVVISRGYR